jgi:hypothetical protein
MSQDLSYWWKIPENREWYTFFQRWLAGGSIAVLLWTVCCFLVFAFVASEQKYVRDNEFDICYSVWWYGSFVLIGIILYFFSTAVSNRYKQQKLIYYFSLFRIVLSMAFICFCVWFALWHFNARLVSHFSFVIINLPFILGTMIFTMSFSIDVLCLYSLGIDKLKRRKSDA